MSVYYMWRIWQDSLWNKSSSNFSSEVGSYFTDKETKVKGHAELEVYSTPDVLKLVLFRTYSNVKKKVVMQCNY